MVSWHLGTVGFSYKDWEDVFYPTNTPSRAYLSHYSQIFDAVEIDSTFYGNPPAGRVKHWANTTPPGFKFCVKTPRQITHEMRLINASNAMSTFLDRMQLLGDKLGAVLIQLPPAFTAAEYDTVARFLEELPIHFRYAIEFRHPSWFSRETVPLLDKFNVCWTSTDYLNLPKQVILTTSFFYIRWLGRHGQFKHKDREQADVTPQLEWWWAYIQPHLERIEAIYGFFNNDYAGHSPSTCNRFKAIVGLPINRPQLPRQDKLF